MSRATAAVILALGLTISATTFAQVPAASAPGPVSTDEAAAATGSTPISPTEAPSSGATGAKAVRSAPTGAAHDGAVKAANPKAAEAAEQAEAGNPADTTTPAATARGVTATKRSGPGANTDRLELGTTEISGNRELPKVLYVVPWRRPEPGDQVGRPPNSLIEEALTPVDREVFQRQNSYYAALSSSAAPAKSQPAPAGAAAARGRSQDER
jgi:hypothetical protein